MNPNRAREQSRTSATVESYLRRANGLMTRLAKEMALPDDAYPPPEAIVAFMKRNAPQWKWSTFRQYQASLACRYDIEAERTGNALFTQTAEEIRTLPYGDCVPPNAVGQTSSRKRKGIRKADYDLLVANLSNPTRNGRYAKRASLWLMAAVATGLRPREWEYAELDETTGLLHARNAKATNGRGTGPTRSVPVAAEDMGVVRAHIASVREMLAAGKSFTEIHENCAVAVNRACKALWGDDPTKRYALYSARHQFSANVKAVHNHQEVARLLGHASTRTARTHYAPKRSAWPKYRDQTKPAPTPKPEGA
ncbi:site-specific integrase [Cupriavidus taiwanensis]|uniref:site-specific integrase n=1 Tax=Cupriavidus taiwanensis TaxID=164546 RepID=UPI000E2FEF59|nr:site-specific integrase [Cupriavidus taiwanensis]